MSILTVSPSEISFSLNNATQFKLYMIYQDVYLEIGPTYKFGIGKTTPTEDIHVGGNMHLNNPKNITYNSGFKITVSNSPLAFVPIGTIVLWPVPNSATVINSMTLDDSSYAPYYSSLPYGWILCEGQPLLRTQFPTLFAMIGTLYGSPSGSYFNVPNFKGGYGIVNRDVENTRRQLNGKYLRSDDGDVDINVFELTAGHLPYHRHFGTSGTTDSAAAARRHRHSVNYVTSGTTGGIGGGSSCANSSRFYQNSPSTTLSHNHNGITNTNISRSVAYNPSINLEQPYICLRYIIRIF